MHRGKIVVISLFCGMLGLISAASLILPDRKYSAAENRALTARPEWSAEDLYEGIFQESYEEYLCDQMIWRDGWVKFAAGLERAVGRMDVNGVYAGRDGYLLERYSEADFDRDQMEENISYLSGFLDQMVRDYGKEHVTCLMVPSKADALPNQLPPFACSGTAGADGVRMLTEQLQNPDVLFDLREVFPAHRKEYIYYRTDHHWTTLGAYYAYCAWAEKTGRDARPAAEYTREEVSRDFYGSTYHKLPLSVPRDTVELFRSPAEEGVRVDINQGETVSDSPYFMEEAEHAFRCYDVFFSKNAGLITIQTKAKTGRKLLLVKDSFANCFVPFLLGDFDEIVMIDCRYSKRRVGEITAEFKGITDVMALYNTEQFLQETSLRMLDARKVGDTMEEFDAEDFLEGLD